MSYDVLLERHVQRALRKLPGDVLDRIVEVLDGLADEPRPTGSKRLTGVDGYRIRRGPYRVLYTIDDKARLVRVYRVGHRREIYRR